MRVLLIEDDPEVAAVIVQGLGENDVRVDHESTFSAGLFRGLEGEFTVIILDLRLPGGTVSISVADCGKKTSQHRF